jgi:beta-N-acetylhexosaminidase
VSAAELPLSQVCGQLLVGGFAGPELPASLARALRAGRRGGAILFRRNCASLEQTAELCAAIAHAAPPDLPPLIGVDQEGGRVQRLPAPVLTLPPMRRLGEIDDPALTERAGACVGAELRALGFNMNFAPVLDVDSNPANPVIGDRSFSREPAMVSRHGLAFARGLQREGVLACGKHFPGHGDTDLDSHVALPVVDASCERLEQVELPPFEAACRAGVASLMSAHVVYRCFEPERPATLCSEICTSLLREQLGFEGVLLSDDLEMGAIADRYGIDQAAVLAVEAGCDALLICSDEAQQEQAHGALVRQAERDAEFRARCCQAAERVLAMRRRCPPQRLGARAVGEPTGGTAAELLGRVVGAERSQRLAAELARALAVADSEPTPGQGGESTSWS